MRISLFSGGSVPWSSIVAMRNRLVHAYFDIDRDIPWATAHDEIPLILEQSRGLSSRHDHGPGRL
jgi:uncharacterized protein with HEPN domain